MAASSGIRAGRAYVELGVNNKLSRGLKKAQARLKAMGATARQVGTDMLRVSGGVAAGLGIAVKIAADFDDRMRVVRAVTGATEDQFRSLREEAKRLGRTTSFTASQVADGMAELGRAGFSPTEILASTEAVLALSRATSTELPRATEIAGAALRGFNLPAEEMGRVTDVLTATANGSAQTLEDLFEAFKPVAPLAAETGESIEQTAAAIAVLANNGIKGSLAGNALARAYKNLSSEAGQAKIKEFGVDAVDSAGNLRPLSSIINDLARSTANLGTAERLSVFETLFGRGQAAALKLASSSTAFDELERNITDSAGLAVRTAEEMDAGIGGSFRRLLSAAEGLAIAVGEAIAGPVAAATEFITKYTGVVTEFISKNKQIVTAIAALVAIGLVGSTVLIGIGVAFGIAAFAAGGFATFIGAIVAGLGLVLSPIALTIAGVTALGVALVASSTRGGDAIRWLMDRFGELRAFAGKVISGISDALMAGDMRLAAEVLWKGIAVAWQRGAHELNKIWRMVRDYWVGGAREMLIRILDFFGISVGEIDMIFTHTMADLGNVWARFASGFQSVWERSVAFVSKRILELQGLFDGGLDVDAAKKSIDSDLKSRLDEIDEELTRGLEERDARRRERVEEIKADKGLTADQRIAKERERRERASAEAIAASESSLADAQRQLEAALTEARRRREESQLTELGTTSPELPERARAATAAAADAAARGVGTASLSTSNAEILRRLGSSDTAKDPQTKSLEKISEQIGEIGDVLKKRKVVWSG